MTTPGLELVFALAGAEVLSVLIDEIDEPERTRRLWEPVSYTHLTLPTNREV